MKATAQTITRRPPTLLLPALFWLSFFFVFPLLIVIGLSFLKKGTYGGVEFNFSLANYARSSEWIYLRIFWSSLKLASFTTFACLLLGYPMAYLMATSSRSVRSVLLVLVVIPFWTNFVVRAYALKLMLGETGPLNRWLVTLGIIQTPIAFSNTDFSVWIGMVTNYLPFMVLPLYVALEKFDFTLMEAAKDLGAKPFQILFKILIPLTSAGILAGTVFVFAPALGEFVIPDLLGGARTMLIGNLITDQFLKTRDWPFGAALSMILIVMVMLCLGFYLKQQMPRKT
jgi:spermidine/putrescine transport system permease protein